jgi:integrase
VGKAGRRGNGEGSIYKNSRGKWTGAVVVAWRGPQQQPQRRYVYGDTAAEVRRKMDEIRRAVETGQPAGPSREHLREYLKRWLDNKRHSIAPKSLMTYEDLLNRYVLDRIGDVALAKLTPQLLQDLLNQIADQSYTRGKKAPVPVSPKTVKHVRDVLRAALNQAVKWGLIARNPAALVDPPKPREVERITLSAEQARNFLAAIRGHRCEAMIVLALCMGMREGEALAVGMGDVDLEARRLTVRGTLQRIRPRGAEKTELQIGPTKSNRARRLILPAFVVERIREQLARRERDRQAAGAAWQESGLLFTTRKGTMMEARNLLREYYALRAAAKLPAGLRFHDLRHSAATILHAAGVPEKAIQELLGHRSLATTQQIYMHAADESRQQAADAMDDLLDDLPKM